MENEQATNSFSSIKHLKLIITGIFVFRALIFTPYVIYLVGDEMVTDMKGGTFMDYFEIGFFSVISMFALIGFVLENLYCSLMTTMVFTYHFAASYAMMIVYKDLVFLFIAVLDVILIGLTGYYAYLIKAKSRAPCICWCCIGISFK